MALEEGGMHKGSQPYEVPEKDLKSLEFLLCEIIVNFIFSALEMEYSVHG